MIPDAVIDGTQNTWGGTMPSGRGVSEATVPTKFEPGNVNYELAASLVGILDYAQSLGTHHGLGNQLDLAGCFAAIAEHEEQLVRPLLVFLEEHPRTRLIGSSSPARMES